VGQKVKVIRSSVRNAEQSYQTPNKKRKRRSQWLKLSILQYLLNVLLYFLFLHWEFMKSEGQNISPFWRAIFAVFFCHGLFKKVLESSKSNGYKELYSPGWLATAYIALLVIGNGLSRAESSDASIIWLIVALINFVPLLSVQKAINFNNEKLKNDNGLKQGFSGGEVTLIVVGVIWSLLVLIGTFSS
jgi:hypothetical protein